MRIRWYEVSGAALNFRSVARAMRQRSLAGSSTGFLLREVTESKITGAFVEVMEWDDVLSLPGRGEVPIHRVELHRTEFLWDFESSWLEVVDFPRTLKGFRNALTGCAGDIGLQVPSCSVKDWALAVEREFGRVTISRIATRPVAFSATTSAAYMLQGVKDVRRHLAGLPSGASVEWAKAEVRTEDDGVFELSMGGRAFVKRESTMLRGQLRNALTRLRK